jgi:phage terminase Nu1 subunit (DNA packaging protein)
VEQQPKDKKHQSVPVRVEFNKLQKTLVSKKCIIALRQNAWQAQYDNGMVNMGIRVMRQVCSEQGKLVMRMTETAAEWYRQHKNKVGGTKKIENS